MFLQVGTRFGPYEILSAIRAVGASARSIASELQRALAVAQKRRRP
jgi:hypothetical protein